MNNPSVLYSHNIFPLKMLGIDEINAEMKSQIWVLCSAGGLLIEKLGNPNFILHTLSILHSCFTYTEKNYSYNTAVCQSNDTSIE